MNHFCDLPQDVEGPRGMKPQHLNILASLPLVLLPLSDLFPCLLLFQSKDCGAVRRPQHPAGIVPCVLEPGCCQGNRSDHTQR